MLSFEDFLGENNNSVNVTLKKIFCVSIDFRVVINPGGSLPTLVFYLKLLKSHLFHHMMHVICIDDHIFEVICGFDTDMTYGKQADR